MTVGHKNNAMTFFRNRAGMFVMLAPVVDWETAMTAYDARNNAETAFDIFKNELDGKRGRIGGPARARGSLLIESLAPMVRVRMQITVSRSKSKNLAADRTSVPGRPSARGRHPRRSGSETSSTSNSSIGDHRMRSSIQEISASRYLAYHGLCKLDQDWFSDRKMLSRLHGICPEI